MCVENGETVPCKTVDDRLAQLQKIAGDDGLNLDGISQDDCMSVWAAIHFAPVRAARLLFTDRPEGYVRAARHLRNYATNKAAAMGCRGRGDISNAQMYEKICDQIYDKLPEFARTW